MADSIYLRDLFIVAPFMCHTKNLLTGLLFRCNVTIIIFLPHHAVVRETSTTTKQRTVYDASAKSSNGYSLNDRCLIGPTIQPELVDIFIRWRTHNSS